MDLYELILNWQDIGVFNILLPFVLVFAISYGVFSKISLFGTASNKINVVVSFVLALLFLQNDVLIVRLQAFLPQISFALIAILMGLMILSIFSSKTGVAWGEKAGWVAIIISVVVLVSALSHDPTSPYESSSFWQWITDFWYGMSPGAQGLVVFIIIGAVLMMFLTGGGGGAKTGFVDTLKDIFRGPGSGGGKP